MLHKKTTLTVESRRSVTAFFNRLQDRFERKFDGFPATIEGGSMPAVEEGPVENVDYGSIIEQIASGIYSPPTAEIPQCPDLTDEEYRGCFDYSDPVWSNPLSV